MPSSFSSTIWSSKTLSYRVWGGFTADGMMSMQDLGCTRFSTQRQRCEEKSRRVLKNTGRLERADGSLYEVRVESLFAFERGTKRRPMFGVSNERGTAANHRANDDRLVRLPPLSGPSALLLYILQSGLQSLIRSSCYGDTLCRSACYASCTASMVRPSKNLPPTDDDVPRVGSARSLLPRIL